MRFQISPQDSAAAIRRPATKVYADYAPLVRQEDRRRRRRETVWAMLSFVALVLCWDLSARLDRSSFGGTAASAAHHETAQTGIEPRSPRRLRKLSEEAEASRSLAWTDDRAPG